MFRHKRLSSDAIRFAPNWRLAILRIIAINGLVLPVLFLIVVWQLSHSPQELFRSWQMDRNTAGIILVAFNLLVLGVCIRLCFEPFESMLITITKDGVFKPDLPKPQFLQWLEVKGMLVDPLDWKVVLTTRNKRMRLDLALLKNPKHVVEEIEKHIPVEASREIMKR